MKSLIHEDNTNSITAPNPLGAWLDAKKRNKIAGEACSKNFDTDQHVDRVVKVGDIVKDFFGSYPDYHTKRANRKRPFETVKVSNCGHILSRRKVKEKNEKLYGPLLALGNVEVKSTNGHLLIRVFA